MPGGEPVLIPDLSVLLSAWGVWLVQHLALRGPVWLPRALVLLLEGDGMPLDATIATDIAPMVAVWNRCWPDMVQRPSVHWFSDALDMSHAPKGDPAALLDRFDALIAGLDRKLPMQADACEPELDRLMLDGARDALALAATLREPAIVLSTAGHAASEPWACRALDRFGLSGHRLADEKLRDLLAEPLLRHLAAAGLGPLLGSGVLRLAALHPANAGSALPLMRTRPAIGAAVHGEPNDDALWSAFENADDDSLWNDSVTIWYEMP